MRQWPDLPVGYRCGRLVVLGPGDRSSRYVRMRCRCDCGVETLVRRNILAARKQQSCGCARQGALTPARVGNRTPEMVGLRFGRLTVVSERAERDAQRRRVWVCRCDCGAFHTVDGTALRTGETTSCGCLQRQEVARRQAGDLTGQRFGRLVALHSIGGRSAGYLRWRCACDCGQETDLRSNSLTSGEVVSCGCAVGEGPVRNVKVRALAAVRGMRRRDPLTPSELFVRAGDISAMWRAQGGLCASPGCDRKLSDGFHRDHVRPLKRGGTSATSNIQLLCPPCNLKKGSRVLGEPVLGLAPTSGEGRDR